VSERDHADAAELATRAGKLLLELRARLDDPDVDVVRLRDEGDRRSHEFLMAELAARHPDDAVLSEEGADDQLRLEAERVWIIDPLDGTREFGEAGRSDWAVHVALVERGQLVAGAVALPAAGVTFSTGAPPPVPPPAPGSRLRLVVSRTRRPAEVLAAAERLDAELVEMGSAGAKTMAILQGTVDVYAHTGGQYEWDSAAPAAVAMAAGLSATRLDGSPLVYNAANPWLPDLLVCRPEDLDRVLAAFHG
jgi:3'(2'), 5'-bisphosphate nucleotidase